MPNLLLTNYCNRSCPYCFAKQKVDLEKAEGLEGELKPAILKKG